MSRLGIAVSNTSPLVALHRIGQSELPARMFQCVLVPEAVAKELEAFSQADPKLLGVLQIPSLEKRVLRRHEAAHAWESRVHGAEAEALLLAVETRADWVLVDEREARSAARRLGLRVVGTVGILLRAKREGWIVSVRQEIERLRGEGQFWLSEELVQAVLRAAGEEPEPRA